MLKKKVSLKSSNFTNEIGKQKSEANFKSRIKIQSPESENSDVETSRLKTYCRLRPYDEGHSEKNSFFKKLEKEGDNFNQILQINKSDVEVKSFIEYGNKFIFDQIFDDKFSQIEIFQEACIPLVENLVNQRKSSIVFTSGLNDSGKSYTIIGETNSPGILPLSLRFIYDRIVEKREGGENIQMLCNFVEIYDKDAYDLLSAVKKAVKISTTTTKNIWQNATFFNLNTIQDFSHALNTGNNRKKMLNKTSMSFSIFKLILRFPGVKDKTYEECSMTIIDSAFPTDRKFINLNNSSIGNTKSEGDLYNIHISLCNVLMTIKKGMPNGGRIAPIMRESQLTLLLRYYFYGDEDIVLITNIHPKYELNEENMKVLNFAKRFREAIQVIDDCYIKRPKQNLIGVSEEENKLESAKKETGNKKGTLTCTTSFMTTPHHRINTQRLYYSDTEDKILEKHLDDDEESTVDDNTTEYNYKDKLDHIQKEYLELKIQLSNQERMMKDILNRNGSINLKDANCVTEKLVESTLMAVKNLDVEHLKEKFKFTNLILINPTIHHLNITHPSDNTQNKEPLQNKEKLNKEDNLKVHQKVIIPADKVIDLKNFSPINEDTLGRKFIPHSEAGQAKKRRGRPPKVK